MAQHIVTREYIADKLTSTDQDFVSRFIGRALVVLFNRQTVDEKSTNDTKHHNMMGFTGADARQGSLSAKYFLKHGKLEDWQIKAWTRPNKHGVPRLAKYWQQLDQAAKQKAGG
jgi:hypothetical protein